MTIEMTIMEEAGLGLEKYNTHVILEGMIEEAVAVDLDQVQEPVQIDRIRCLKCRDYDHFTNDCPNSDTEEESKQIQKMYNLDKNQTVLQMLAADYEDLIETHSEEAKDHLNS